MYLERCAAFPADWGTWTGKTASYADIATRGGPGHYYWAVR